MGRDRFSGSGADDHQLIGFYMTLAFIHIRLL